MINVWERFTTKVGSWESWQIILVFKLVLFVFVFFSITSVMTTAHSGTGPLKMAMMFTNLPNTTILLALEKLNNRCFPVWIPHLTPSSWPEGMKSLYFNSTHPNLAGIPEMLMLIPAVVSYHQEVSLKNTLILNCTYIVVWEVPTQKTETQTVWFSMEDFQVLGQISEPEPKF